MLSLVLWSQACVMEREVGSDSFDTQAATPVLLCQQGLSDRTVGWDKGLFDFCESLETKGFTLVHDGDYPAFGALDEDGAYAALFATLDTNDDGVVNHHDRSAKVHLAGFSWGGINISDIADRLRRDGRIASSRRGVSGMVLFDPFQPQRSRSIVPSNVERAWIYRQTDTTEGDCSLKPSLGFGFNGHRPLARSANTQCFTYDLDEFMHGIGHCDVPRAASQAAFVNFSQHKRFAQWDSYADMCDLE
jgi:pimeloyl-ACP methyl ester carboxylesterase